MTLPDHIRRKAESIRLAVFDVDGVMTDGSILLDDRGGEIKAFHAHDGLGLVALQQAGVSVAIISSRTSQAVARRMLDLDVPHVLQGVRDKALALQGLLSDLRIHNNAMAFVGDDLIDLPAMAVAGLSIAVANARPEVLARADWVTQAGGGHGGVREVCELLLQAQGKLAGWLKSYTG